MLLPFSCCDKSKYLLFHPSIVARVTLNNMFWTTLMSDACAQCQKELHLKTNQRQRWVRRRGCVTHPAHVPDLNPHTVSACSRVSYHPPYCFTIQLLEEHLRETKVVHTVNLLVCSPHHDHSPWSFAIRLTEIITCAEVMDYSSDSLPTLIAQWRSRHAGSPSWSSLPSEMKKLKTGNRPLLCDNPFFFF